MSLRVFKKLIELNKQNKNGYQLTYNSNRQFSGLKESIVSLIKGDKENDEDKDIIISQQEYQVLNLKNTSSIKNIYLQYKKHVSFYHPNTYKGKDRDDKIQMYNEVYMKIISQRIQTFDAITEEDRKELEMLEKSNFGLINYESKTVSDQLTEIDDQRYEWEPHEPKHYILFLFSSWVFLGAVTLSMERW